MKTSKLCLLNLCALITAASFLNAQATFFDDFNRANTNGVGGGLGPDWDTVSTVFVNSNVAKTQTAADQLALYNGFDLNTSFDVSLDAYSQSNGRYVGIAFNYTDADNYYVIRAGFNGNTTDNQQTSAWQFLKMEGGSQSVLDSGTIAIGSMPLNAYRTISLSSTETVGSYQFTVTDLAGTTTYLDVTISDSTFGIAGQAGIHFGNSFTWADNFSLSTIPEPQTYGLLIGGVALSGAFLRRRLNK